MRLADFKVLSFDCYGTLIDWETGILSALQPLTRQLSKALTDDQVLETYARHEHAQEVATPDMIYSKLLGAVHQRIVKEWGVKATAEDDARFGASVGSWPAFADSAAALHYLKKHYALVILSNVDRESFRGSNARLAVEFDAIYTAEDIGSYKPDPRNFEYLVSKLAAKGYGKKDILHTAESLFHDHAPANRAGLASAWIHRRHAKEGFGATARPCRLPHYDFRFTSLQGMADAHAAELRGLKRKANQ